MKRSVAHIPCAVGSRSDIIHLTVRRLTSALCRRPSRVRLRCRRRRHRRRGNHHSRIARRPEVPLRKMKFVASGRSAGRKMPFAGREIVGRGVARTGFRRRGPGHQQHARRGRPRLHPRRRPPRLRGDRRERLLADGPQRAAGDPGGQSARHPPAQGDHRQSQLLDDADGPGPQAARTTPAGSAASW